MKLNDDLVVIHDRDVAAWFIANGHPMKGSGLATNGRLVEFYFEKSAALEQLKEQFQVNADVPVKTLLNALDEVWRVIKQQRNEA